MNTQNCKSCHHTKWEQSFIDNRGRIMKTCIDCREKRKINIRTCQRFAINKNGLCLSEEYKNNYNI